MKSCLTICAVFALTLVCVPAALAQPAGGPPAGMSGMPGMGATEVGYVVLAAEDVPLTTTLPGRVSPSATAQVRPQVGGIITSVEVTEGTPVTAGDLLFTIDDKTYRAELAVAEASLASARAQLPSAQSKVTRYEKLVGSGGVTETDLETARVELDQAQAAVQSAEAQLELKQISLEQTRITAPISGMLGTVNAEVGALVTAGQADALATVRTIDPAKVDLVESSRTILALRPQDAAMPTPQATPSVHLTLEDGRLYDEAGTISSADLVVSETTGTVTMRATLPNPDRLLLPGMFVRAHIDIGETQNAFLVPQRAVTFNTRGEATAYVVTAENTAEQRVLTATRDMNNAWVVTGGVAAGDRLIVDGLQKISDGTAVTPVEVTISDNGVVYQQLGASGPPPDGTAPPQGDAASTPGATTAPESAQ